MFLVCRSRTGRYESAVQRNAALRWFEHVVGLFKSLRLEECVEISIPVDTEIFCEQLLFPIWASFLVNEQIWIVQPRILNTG